MVRNGGVIVVDAAARTDFTENTTVLAATSTRLLHIHSPSLCSAHTAFSMKCREPSRVKDYLILPTCFPHFAPLKSDDLKLTRTNGRASKKLR